MRKRLADIRRLQTICRQLRRRSNCWTTLELIDGVQPLLDLLAIEEQLRLPEPPVRERARIEYRRMRRELLEVA